MAHWLFKADPEDDYSWSDLVRDGRQDWTGVRNYMARNNMKAMKLGEEAFFYHSQTERTIVGIVRISREAFPDPSSPDDPRWECVEVMPVRALKRPVNLAEIREDALLSSLYLIRQPRLSVMPIPDAAWQRILDLSEQPA